MGDAICNFKTALDKKTKRVPNDAFVFHNAVASYFIIRTFAVRIIDFFPFTDSTTIFSREHIMNQNPYLCIFREAVSNPCRY